MNCKKRFFVGFSCLLFSVNYLFAQVLMPTAIDSRQILTLNGIWKFKYLPGTTTGSDSTFYDPTFNADTWAKIKVPGNWEMQGFAEPSYGKNLKKGIGLYRTTFGVPAGWNGKPIYIVFDGVEFGYSLWVNGKLVGEFASAYNRQIFDISTFVSMNEINSLAVKVITQPKGYEFDTNDDWSISGISRSITLFSLPTVHICDVVIKTTVATGAAMEINALVEKTDNAHFPKKLTIRGELVDASGKVINKFTLPANATLSDATTIAFATKVPVTNPQLWTAETPYLYTLRLFLKDNTAELQKYTQHVGIREITWANGVLKLNGSAIKLKGANHHDLSPTNGRAITEAGMRKDLKLMREANINFIRTSHYPPADPFLDLCDSMGFYVMDEIPYGFGDQHLKDSSYLPILLQRAKSTVWRDKNHPSVIIWSVGNENPVTNIGLQTGRYVKRLDGTRPYCFPQYPSEFESMLKAIPDSLDLLNDHYPTVADLKNYAPKLDRPMISGEYAHSLGLDFNSMEGVYEALYANPNMAGGAVWALFDQGILQKSPKKIAKGEFTFYAWPTADSMYNTSTNEGADGIVYANRVPQVDYYQARKIYTPVKMMDDTLKYQPGKASFTIQVENRYDFTNLSAVKCKLQFYADTVVISSGILSLNCAPHKNIAATINTILPAKPTANYYYLKLIVEDKKHYTVYKKTFPIQVTKNTSILSRIASENVSKTTLSGEDITANNYGFAFAKETGSFVLKNKAGDTLIAQGPFARVGRKATISEVAAVARAKQNKQVQHTLWNPFILTHPEVQVKTYDAHQLLVHCKYQPDSPQNRSKQGEIAYRLPIVGTLM